MSDPYGAPFGQGQPAAVAAPTKVVWWRVLAWVIDFIPTVVLFVISMQQFAEKLPTGSARLDGGNGLTLEYGGDYGYLAQDGDAAKVLLVVVGFVALNWVVLQGLTGASIGKLLTGLCVVRPDGSNAGLLKCLIRWLVTIVDSFPYFAPIVGFVMVLSTRGNRRLGDMAADTYVVRRSDAGRPIQVEPVHPGYGGGSPQVGWGPQAGWGAPPQDPWAPQPGPAAQPRPAAQTAPPGEPQWDPQRMAWIRWDGQAWTQHDQASNTWGPIR